MLCPTILFIRLKTQNRKLKTHFWYFPFGGNFYLEEVTFTETEHACNNIRREHLNLVIESKDLVIVALP